MIGWRHTDAQGVKAIAVLGVLEAKCAAIMIGSPYGVYNLPRFLNFGTLLNKTRWDDGFGEFRNSRSVW